MRCRARGVDVQPSPAVRARPPSTLVAVTPVPHLHRRHRDFGTPQDASTAALMRCPNAGASLRAAPSAKPTSSFPMP